MGGTSVYSWIVYCSYQTVTNECQNWNNNATTNNTGALFYTTTSDCPGDGYPCAKLAADNMITCLYNYSIANCQFTNQSWVQGAFPNTNTYLTQKDVEGHPGTLANALCDAMSAAQFPCSNH
jgi:hypothetical protein